MDYIHIQKHVKCNFRRISTHTNEVDELFSTHSVTEVRPVIVLVPHHNISALEAAVIALALLIIIGVIIAIVYILFSWKR